MPLRAQTTTARSHEALLRPPSHVSDGNRWYDVSRSDPVARYLAEHAEAFSPAPESPPHAHRVTALSGHDWQVTRLLGAAYVYRSARRRVRVVAKFYSTKTDVTPEIHAERELAAVELARRTLGRAVVAPVAHWRGVLLMPFVPGLTLENLIAVRRTRAGELDAGLGEIAELLARLHERTLERDSRPDFGAALDAGQRFVDHLACHGPLTSDPLLHRAIDRLLSRWGARSSMSDFVPVFVHGDPTTGNFIVSPQGTAIALDWERATLADPAHDLGRVAAEVIHSIAQNDGTVAEALPIVERLTNRYCAALPASFGCDALRSRAGYYQAISCLRIARNAWSAPRRIDLIAQAIALLSEI